jgi:diguanylate cyclase (GGDEF)-like protein
MLVLRDVRGLVLQRREALTDDLTGLPNRRALFRALELLTRDGGTSRERADLLVIDIDGFRELNETLGHQAGDALLLAAAERLKPVVGADLLVRLGADEFAAIIRSPANAERVAAQLREVLAPPIELEDVTVAIEGTVGIATFPDDARDAGELARRADVAMSDAKRRRIGVARYAGERDEHSRDRLELAADLRRALVARDNGGLWAAFQPQIELATGRVTGAETLIRWTHPVRGEISPAELLPVAERSGQMAALTDWVLDRALSECAGLRNQGIELRIGVNVSAVTLVDIGLPERIAAALHHHRVAPQQLVIEVTEDAVMSDQRRCLDVLEHISALGVEISVDDFGTGQSSLAQLRHLPADELKIDRSFVKGMAEDPLDAEVVRLVVGMGRSMGLRVVAEGIETPDERDVLERLGCDMAQGFGLGRPMPARAFGDFLADTAQDPGSHRYAA